MRILIVGAGAVGFHLARHLSEEAHDIVLIDRDPELVASAQDQLDIMTIAGNGASLRVLERAGIDRAEILIAVTNVDEVNLIACMAARPYDVRVKVARVSNPEYYDPGVLRGEQLGVDLMINPELECAREIFQLLQLEAVSELAFFADGRVQLVGMEVQPDAPVVGRTLAELGASIKNRRFLTAAIGRNGETLIPRGENRFQAGDRVYIIGEPGEMPRVLELAGYDRFKLQRVMIGGGSRIASFLGRILAEHGVEATIIEADRERCVELATMLEKALILHGNITDLELLEMEGVDATDGFVALTGTDDTNMLSSLLAKSRGAHKVVALIGKLDYIPLANRVGIDAAVSPRLSAVNSILRFVRRGAVVAAAALRGIDAEAIEFNIHSHSPLAGRSLAEIDFPDHSLVGAVVREDRILIPSGTTVLQPGDKVTVLALPDAVRGIERLFE